MGSIIKSDEISQNVSSHDTTHYSYASVSSSYPLSNAYHGSSNTTYGQVSWKTGSGAETYVYLRFDFSEIPENAIIKSVSASAKGYINTTNSSRVTTRQMQLASGTTLKGSALTLSTSTSTRTFSDTGSWTRNELQSAGVRYYVKRGTSNPSSAYQLRLYGATMTVTYEWEATTYTITVNNSTSTIFTATPDEVVSGENSILRVDTITDIIIKDNDNDITNQFVLTQEDGASYNVENITSYYGFELNQNDYYESNNNGHSLSCALCKVNFYLPVSATVTFSVINYAESTYDFGLLSDIDKTLDTNASADSSNVYWSGKNNNSSSVQNVVYQIDSGEHFIYVKYFKDNYTDSYNDSLQFKISIVLNESFTPGQYYKYTIYNIQNNHIIAVDNVIHDCIYVKINNVWVSALKAYKKINNVWIEQNDLSSVFENNINYIKG